MAGAFGGAGLAVGAAGDAGACAKSGTLLEISFVPNFMNRE